MWPQFGKSLGWPLLAATGPAVFGTEASVSIALCQIFALDGDREGNFVRIESAIKVAVQEGAEIVCFPETCVLGWVNPQAHERACPIPGKDSNRLSQLARQYKVHLCVGLAEKQGDRLYDSVILIDDQGNILLKHRKINILAHLMDPPYTPGQEVQVCETRFGRIGLLICADSFEMPVCERMRKLKPDLVLIPYGWAAAEDKWPQHGKSLKSVVQRAAQTIKAPVIGTDLVGQISHGPWKGMVYGGQSVAAKADGDVVAVGKDRQQDIVVVTVNLGPTSVGSG
jgi:predicted amidohydrolase